MSQKHQVIVIGLGATGVDVVESFIGGYGQFAGSGRPRTIPQHISVVTHREGLPAQEVQCDRRHVSHDEGGLLAAVAEAFERVLAERPDSDYSAAYQLDVFLCGAWADAEFGHHLPLVLAFIEKLGHEHYETMFTTRDDRQNARLLVHPLALSANLPREPRRRAIAKQLTRIADWHERLTEQRRAFIPRFFIYDGFTNNLQMTQREMVDITANFLGLCACSGARAQTDLRSLLNFAMHGRDFFSVLNLATIRFDRARFQDAALDAVVTRFEQILLEKPAPQGATASGGQLTTYIESEIVRAPHFDDSIPALDYRDTIVATARKYEARPRPDLPLADNVDVTNLFNDKKTFPKQAHLRNPESLDLFFDRRWLAHIEQAGQPTDDTGVADDYRQNCQKARADWYQALLYSESRLDDGLRDLMGPHRANYSLAAFCAELYRIRTETIAEGYRALQVAARLLPARRWEFSALRHLWARLRTQIWNTVPRDALVFWIPTFAVLATVQTIAVFRYFLVRMDKSTDGVKLLTRFDGGVFELPVMVLLSLMVAMTPALFIYFLKQRRLRPYLDERLEEEAANLTETLADESPEVLQSMQDQGVLPTAIVIMARKMGKWWFLHGKLGALGMAGALLKVTEARLEDVRVRAEQSLTRIEERHRTRRPQIVGEAAATYFIGDLTAPLTPAEFADIISGGRSPGAAAENVAHELFLRTVDDFLETIVDEDLLRDAVLKGMLFFSEGDVFTIPACALAVERNLRAFVDVLDDRLSHGQIFHYLATEEEDNLIEDSQILLVAPVAAQEALENAIQQAGVNYRRLYGDRNLDHIWGLRMIRDISTRSVIRYMLADTTIEQADIMMAAWIEDVDGGTDGPKAPPLPWSELRLQA